MEELKIPDDILMELERMQQMAEAGLAVTPPPDFLAAFVRLQRGMRQWKQDTLASFANVSLSTVERIERGQPVSKGSLDRVAEALGYKAGDFSEPRVPLTSEEFALKIEEELAVFADRVTVAVKPLRTQPQVTALARTHFYLIDGSQLRKDYEGDIAELREWLDLAAFVVSDDSARRPGRNRGPGRRNLYADVLAKVQDIERRAFAVALAGTYTAKTNAARMPSADVALVSFFPRCTDPGAVRRKVLFAPETIDLQAAWLAFCEDNG